MSVALGSNRLQSTIDAVRVTVSRPKRLQTVARFEKNYRMTQRAYRNILRSYEDPYCVCPPGLSKSRYFQTLSRLLVVKDDPGPYTAVRNGKG